MKRIKILLLIFVLIPGFLFAKIDDQKVSQVKQEFKDGLEMLTKLPQDQRELLINKFADSLTKLWVLEHANVEDGTFQLYINAADMFIDAQGNIYFKAESTGYIKIGTDKYNIKGPITIINKIDAYKKEQESKSIFQVAAMLGGCLYTDFQNIDYDVLFIIQTLKIKKISIGPAFGIRSLGFNTSYYLTKNFSIGLYGGIAYPRNKLSWRPIVGLTGSFKF